MVKLLYCYDLDHYIPLLPQLIKVFKRFSDGTCTSGLLKRKMLLKPVKLLLSVRRFVTFYYILAGVPGVARVNKVRKNCDLIPPRHYMCL